MIKLPIFTRPMAFMLIALLTFTTFALAASAVKLFDTSGVPRGIKIATDGSQDVNVQDQVTRPVALRFSKIDDLNITLAEPPTVNGYTITLEAGHEVTAGEHLSIIYEETNGSAHPHYYTPDVVSVATNVITLDEPVPYAFSVDSIVYTSLTSLKVNGAVTTQIYQLTNAYSFAADLTQLVLHITDDAVMDDAKFGALTALTRGVAFRKKFSATHYENIFNVKSNGELGLLAGPEGKAYDDKAPAGIYGLTTKINFSGQGHYGVAIRLEPGESLQILIQDDLTGLVSFVAMAQGHFTN